MIIAGIIIGAFIIIINFYWLCDLISDIQEHRYNKKHPRQRPDEITLQNQHDIGVALGFDTDNRKDYN